MSQLEGRWHSKIATTTIKLVGQEEVVSLANNYNLTQIEFGVEIRWIYYTNPENECFMKWCIVSNEASKIFSQFGLICSDNTLLKDSSGYVFKEAIPEFNHLILNRSFVVIINY